MRKKLRVVKSVDRMRPEDRARAAEWLRQRAHELMGMDYAAEIMPQIDEIVAMAERLSDGLTTETQRTQRKAIVLF